VGGAFDYEKLQAFAAAGSFGPELQLLAFLRSSLPSPSRSRFPVPYLAADAHTEARRPAR